MDESYELQLASVVVSNLLDGYMKDKNTKNKPILIPVTRMNYLFIQWLYENRNQFEENKILEKFDIYSNKCIDFAFDIKDTFASRDIILWDTMYDNIGDLFKYYVFFRKCGIENHVTPMSYRYLVQFLYEENLYRQIEYSDFKEIYGSMFGNLDAIDEKTHKQYQKEFYEEVSNLPVKHCISSSDAGSLLINLKRNIEKSFYSTLFEYPSLKSAEQENNFVQISKEVWEQLIKEESTWKFIQNIDNEMKNVTCQSSYFSIPLSIQNHLPMELISMCGVKVKYKENRGAVTMILTPFVSLKSMDYRDIIHSFHVLYKDIDTTYKIMVDEIFDEQKVEQALFEKGFLEKNCLFKVFYQLLEYYFSYYVGLQFKEYVKKYGISVQYDWTWMEQNMPQEIVQDSKALQNFSIEQMEERMKSLYIEPCYLGRIEKTEKRIEEKKKLTYMRYLFTNCSYENRRITLEQLEQNLMERGCFNQEEFMKNVLLLLEENRLDSSLKNNKEEYRLQKELLPCQNSRLLLDEMSSFLFPYIYAFYRDRTLEEVIEEYESFISRLKVYFHKKGYFNIYSETNFNLCATHFNPTYFSEKDIKQKIEYNFFQVRDYLEGRNREHQKVFELVHTWEL